MENKYILSNQITLYGEQDCLGFGNENFYIKEITRVSQIGTIWRGTLPPRHDEHDIIKFPTDKIIKKIGLVMDFENSILDIKRQNTDTLLNSIVLILANCVNTHNKNSNADLYIYKAMRRVSLLVNKNNYLEVINIINLLLGSFEEL